MRRILRFAEEKAQNTRAPVIHMLRGCKGRDRVLTPQEEASYLAQASGDSYDAAVIGIERGCESGHLVNLQKRHAAYRSAKLKPFPIYTRRHTYGTRYVESGVDRYTLARWMGHSSPSVTARYYVHITARHEQAGFQRFVEYTEKLRAEVVPLASERAQ